MPTPCENYLTVCLHVWANVGQLIRVGCRWQAEEMEQHGKKTSVFSGEYTAEEGNLLRIISRNNPGAGLPPRCIQTTWTDRNMHLGY